MNQHRDILAVIKFTANDGSEGKRWQRIGVAFPTRNGNFALKIDFYPADPTTEIVIGKPKENGASTEDYLYACMSSVTRALAASRSGNTQLTRCPLNSPFGPDHTVARGRQRKGLPGSKDRPSSQHPPAAYDAHLTAQAHRGHESALWRLFSHWSGCRFAMLSLPPDATGLM